MRTGFNMKAAIAACLGALLMVCAACAPMEPVAPTRVKGPPQPSLWVIKDADSTIYLYGTIHLLKAGTDWGGPAAKEAIAKADTIWTELEIDPAKEAQMQGLVMRMGLDPTRKLSSLMDDTNRAAFDRVVAAIGAPRENFEAMKPWLAGITFSVIPMMQAGYDPNSGVDRQIDAIAEAEKKNLRWFETAEEQLQFLAGLPQAVQMQMLYEALAEFEKGGSLLDAMAAAWAAGDDAGLQALVVDDMKKNYPEIYDVILAQRNKRWADILAEEMKGSGVDFVAVGAAHLLGSDSVQAFLAKKGIRAEQIAP